MRRVAIVGGGPGGLMTAWWLGRSRMPLDITLFEASPRLGGKVLTARFDSAPVSYEAGVAELYHYRTYDDPLRGLVRALGLEAIPMAGDAVVMDGRVIRDTADLARVLGRGAHDAVRRFERRAARLRPYEAFYNGGARADNRHPFAARSFASELARLPAPAQRYIAVKTRSDLASEPHAVSALYGIDNLLLDRHVTYYALAGGIERLTEALARTLAARRVLSAPVVHVERARAGRYRVVHRAGSTTAAQTFDAVAVALPAPFLPTISWGGRELVEAMTRHHRHYDYPAHYLRVVALFERPFWRRTVPGAFFQLDAFGGCCVYDEGRRFETGGRGVLSWLIAGADALRLHPLEDRELIALALGSLPAPLARRARALFREGRVHRWVGAVSSRPGGARIQTFSARHRPAPSTHPGLVLVGDYLFDSTLNGVLDSAELASEYLVEHLRG